jgi:O-antigen/teichoic acid export membrane protein
MKFPTLIKDSLHYILFAFLSKGVSFFVTPFITYQISAEEFGKFSETQLFWSIGVIIGSFGLEEIISKYHIDKQPNYKRWYQSIVLFQTLFVIVIGIIFLTYFTIHDLSKFSTLEGTLMFFSWILGTIWYYDYIRYLRISENKKGYIVISSAYIFTQIIFIICGFQLFAFSGYSILLFSYSLTAILFGGISLYQMRISHLNLRDISIIYPVLNFSKNILINNVSEWMLRSLPLVIIASYSNGKLLLGLFTSLSIFTIGFVELSKAIINALLPKMLSDQKKNLKKEIFKLSAIYKILGLSISVVLLILGNSIYRFIINPDYTIQVTKQLVEITIILGLFIFLGLYQNQIISYTKDLSKKISRVQPIIAISIFATLAFKSEFSLENILFILLTGYSVLYLLKEMVILNFHKKIYSIQTIISLLPFLTIAYLL